VLVRSDLNVHWLRCWGAAPSRPRSDHGVRTYAESPSRCGAKVVVTATWAGRRTGRTQIFAGARRRGAGRAAGRHVQLASDVVGTTRWRAEGLTTGHPAPGEHPLRPRETSKDDGERLALAKQLAN